MSRVLNSVIIALALISTSSVPLSAQVAAETTSVRVVYGDLNLSTKSGAQTLFKRMRVATSKVCGSRPAPKQIAAQQRHRICTLDAMLRAVAEINSPLVTAMFTGMAGEKTAAR
jgi:UrcA family protein